MDRWGDARRGARVRADPAQERVPRQVPQSARLPPGRLARRSAGRVRDGGQARRLVRGLLLGPDGVAFRAGADEHRLDGLRRGLDRNGEDSPLAPGGHARDRGGPPRPRHARARLTLRGPSSHDPERRRRRDVPHADRPDGALAKLAGRYSRSPLASRASSRVSYLRPLTIWPPRTVQVT